ncbi:hypothetical protein [Amycolatopsis sp. H20-H5]|uniref:hypothetical protein n=1 Tax=Amycolatopsis sp. H20-H5 TaxID=3046309 RepID=UPI002DB804CB|nr:hypothetical protein [Amycolatopsis sp. H20-H5]MEC3981653.1 hypothetical protein [Amycolatopsis sp. H20-H5]
MHIRARRRSVGFDGRTVTISVAVKGSLLIPDDVKVRFRADEITRVDHSEPTAFKPGRIVFVVPGVSREIVRNVPMFADQLGMTTFQYPGSLKPKVAKLLAEIAKARGK